LSSNKNPGGGKTWLRAYKVFFLLHFTHQTIPLVVFHFSSRNLIFPLDHVAQCSISIFHAISTRIPLKQLYFETSLKEGRKVKDSNWKDNSDHRLFIIEDLYNFWVFVRNFRIVGHYKNKTMIHTFDNISCFAESLLLTVTLWRGHYCTKVWIMWPVVTWGLKEKNSAQREEQQHPLPHVRWQHLWVASRINGFTYYL